MMNLTFFCRMHVEEEAIFSQKDQKCLMKMNSKVLSWKGSLAAPIDPTEEDLPSLYTGCSFQDFPP